VIKRTYWWSDHLNESYVPVENDVRRPVSALEANLVSSELENGQHAPAIDLDVPHRYVPSSTEGHGHLFIDVEMSWDKYERLLKALHEAGLIEDGFYHLSVRRKATFLRPPWIKKAAPVEDPF
jgi:hypothetical protein